MTNPPTDAGQPPCAAATPPTGASRWRVDPRLPTGLAIGLGLAALFLYSHPYYGIWHDATLYTLIALRPLYPDALGGDMFFSAGSQASYTVFPWLHTALIRHLGMELPAWGLARAFGVLWIASVALLARQLMDRRAAWLALALLIAIPAKYGAGYVFGYGESFLSPRTLAESLAVIALWFALRGRWPGAVAGLAAAAAIHPIMALPAILCAVLLADSRRAGLPLGVIGLACLLGAGAVAAWAPIGPLRLLDPAWHDSLQRFAPFLLADQWLLQDWQRALVPLLNLAIALLVLPPGTARRLASRVLVVGAVGLALMLLADRVLPIVLLIQLQPWRWIWIGKVVAILLLVPVAGTLWGRGANGRAILALLGVGWFGAEDALGLEAALCALLAVVVELRAARPPRHLWIAVAALAAVFGFGIYSLIDLPPWLIAAGAALVLWWLLYGLSHLWLKCAAALASATLLALQIVAALEQPRLADYDQALLALQPLQRQIAVNRSVLFTTEIALSPWLALHRRTYLGNVGILFSRTTALAFGLRYQRLKEQAGEDINWFLAEASVRPSAAPSRATFVRVCALPELDFIVTTFAYPSWSARALLAPGATLYMYDCRALAAHTHGD